MIFVKKGVWSNLSDKGTQIASPGSTSLLSLRFFGSTDIETGSFRQHASFFFATVSASVNCFWF